MRILIVNSNDEVCEDLTVDGFWMIQNFIPGQNITRTIATAIQRSVWLRETEDEK